MKQLNYIPYFFLILLLSITGISNNLSLSNVGILFISTMKQPLLAILFITLIVGLIKYIKNIKITVFLLSLLFPFYYLIISVLYKNIFHLEVIILYFLWSFYVFIFSTYWMMNKKYFNRFLYSIIIIFIIILLFGLFAINTKGLNYAYFNNRFSFLYENPNLFVQYGQITFYSIMLLIAFNSIKSYKFLLKVLTPILLFSMFYAAQSRNVMLSIILFYTVYYIYNLKIKLILKILFIISIIIFFTISDLNFLNSASSGRFAMWSFALQDISSNIGLLIGVKENPDLSVLIHSYGKLHEVSNNLVKFHIDNMFIELLIEGGLLGIIIFSLPYILVYKKIKYMEHNQRRVFTAIWISVLGQSFFVTNFTSFFSPISLFLGSITLLPFMSKKINYSKRIQTKK